ncbi:hypothetical protein BJF81_09970 [Ornithinimicrobium sp. CNJ-824]|nr:hypothetical protein BJF81_09970 [Ornithinimicrobium sp. CNJ-824]
MQHHHHRLAELVDRAAEQGHRVRRVLHVEVVQRLVQEQVVGVLRQHHAEEGTLALPAGKLVEVPVPEGPQVDPLQRLLGDAVTLRREPPLAVGEAPETHQVDHGQPGGHVVVLPQHGQLPGHLVGRRPEHVEVADDHVAAVGGQHARDDRQQGRLPGAVGPHQRGERAPGDLQVDGVQHRGAAVVGVVDVGDGDHRREVLMSRSRK